MVFDYSEAFSVSYRTPSVQSVISTAKPGLPLRSDFGTAMPETVSPYERIGIEEEELAIGIDPEDVIQYIGT